jgi:hypothetical protein
VKYIGIDQNGQIYKIRQNPLKELLNLTGYRSYSIMYRDTKNGQGRKAGYVLTLRGYNALWVDLLEVKPWGLK